MALDFPSGPSTGTVYVSTNGTTYTYDGIHWNGQVATPPTDSLSSGTSQLLVAADGTVTFPTLTTMSDSTASVVFNLADAVIAGLVDQSTTSTDFISTGTYGNPDVILAPYVVTEFTVSPPVALLVGDIISGAGYLVPSYVTFVGTDTFSSLIITATDLSNIDPVAHPQPGEVVTLARPVETLAFKIQSPENTSILLQPGVNGNILVNQDLIPLEDTVQSLGSVHYAATIMDTAFMVAQDHVT
jgi:hypothetical protein